MTRPPFDPDPLTMTEEELLGRWRAALARPQMMFVPPRDRRTPVMALILIALMAALLGFAAGLLLAPTLRGAQAIPTDSPVESTPVRPGAPEFVTRPVESNPGYRVDASVDAVTLAGAPLSGIATTYGPGYDGLTAARLPWDVTVEGYLRVQCKRVDRWPALNRVIEWLDAIPQGAELRAVTIADTPGPGHKTRRLIVMDAAEFARWHGVAK